MWAHLKDTPQEASTNSCFHREVWLPRLSGNMLLFLKLDESETED